MKTRKMIELILFFIMVVVTFSSCTKEKGELMIDCTASTPSYKNDVKLIIDNNCLSSGCHDSGSSNGDYTSYDGLKAVALRGTLERRVVIDKTMPVSAPLSLEDRKKIKCWISSGSQNN